MAQADQSVANATFPTVRTDINDNLAALFSQSSGNSAPAVTVAFQPWIDTSSSPAVWKVRNAANSGWITIGTIDASTFSVGGVTAIANGGTGQTTAAAALTALLPSQSGNSGKALVTDGASATWDTTRGLTSGLMANASGASFDFTGIPTWVKRITVMFYDISTNGTSPILIRLGDSSLGFLTTNYSSSGSNITTSATAITTSAAGFILQSAAAAATSYTGNVVITNMALGQWTSTGLLWHSTNTAHSTSAGGFSALNFVPTSLRITTVGGANTFDSGQVNIMYEG